MCRTQIFEDFERFGNSLIINALYPNTPFLPQNYTHNLPTFEFLFRHSSKTADYTLFNISPENRHFLPRKQEFFKFQRTENLKSAR